MSFVSLYNFAAGLREYPIRLEGVLDAKAKVLSGQDELWYVPVDLDDEISLGHIKQYRYSPGVYAESLWVTEIRYLKTLTLPWRRYVCCKELMHVFDNAAERTDTLPKFDQLLEEIESPLPSDAASEMYKSETRTKWMAVLVLCPKPLRDYFKPRWQAEELSDYEIALELQVPEGLVQAMMSESYDIAYNLFIGDQANQLELNGSGAA